MNVFIDTNVLLYYTHGKPSEITALQPIFSDKNTVIHISTQVINEFCNVALKRKLCSEKEVENFVKMFEKTYVIDNVTSSTSSLALNIKSKYKLSFYDALIIATALQNNSEVLYSEDLHHHLKVEKKLKIVNPFK